MKVAEIDRNLFIGCLELQIILCMRFRNLTNRSNLFSELLKEKFQRNFLLSEDKVEMHIRSAFTILEAVDPMNWFYPLLRGLSNLRRENFVNTSIVTDFQKSLILSNYKFAEPLLIFSLYVYSQLLNGKEESFLDFDHSFCFSVDDNEFEYFRNGLQSEILRFVFSCICESMSIESSFLFPHLT
jgi:hypothetical protein